MLSETALDLAAAKSRSAVEIGARAAFGYRVGASRSAPFAALHVELIPYPAEIYALPQGIAGHTPYLWMGAPARRSGFCHDGALAILRAAAVAVMMAGGGCGPRLDVGSDVLWTGLFEGNNFDEWMSDGGGDALAFLQPPNLIEISASVFTTAATRRS